MQKIMDIETRRTSADVVFDDLYARIVSLEMLPGDKLSEAEIATRFGVSRQPVRDAFSRLGNIDLLKVRPQRATEVKRFSLRAIATARFVRLAVELEVLARAAAHWTGALTPEFERNLAAQHAAVAARDADALHHHDYEFHNLLCRAGGADFAFDVIAANKAKVDRLCLLSFSARDAMDEVVADHVTLLAQLSSGDGAAAANTMRTHLSRLDATIADIHRTHARYFED